MKLLAFTILGLIAVSMQAQKLDGLADIRARFEYRHGFGSLMPDTTPAVFVSQRSRITIDYENKTIKLRVSPQNVKVWGDNLSNARGDLNNAFHEAYAEIKLNSRIWIKAGRQELSYDDHRILGNVDWAMQARSHDAFLIKSNIDTSHLFHLGFALNANKETNFHENYTVSQYKALQYFWYQFKKRSIKLSILTLNNGMPYLVNKIEKIVYSQTTGARFVYARNKINLDFSTYIQTGKISTNSVMANYLGLNINYNFFNNLSIGLGGEHLSGKANNDMSTVNKSFNPLYGTNHKFNGYMDYFYVGNHLNTVGLNDIYINFLFAKNKFTAKLTPHCFLTAANYYYASVKQKNYLGTELDLTLGYKLYDNVKIDAGYSQMMANRTLELIKGVSQKNVNNWFYISLIINPKIFTQKL